eukprot:TRINITY_DN43571_c0_g1_i3.p1 TRINITY_DN43571_c0_g1~~TRINITY_DN43571_c0_g1_i3.p1  ORF type:complete len:682 (+),score=161.32 TRINITY_DN43571_c0_g1_i3:137-2182(+)
MIRRPPRSTLSSSSAASDVYKRQDKIRQAAYGSQRGGKRKDSKLDLEKVFRDIDLDGNGVLDQEELGLACQTFGIRLAPRELEAVFSFFDRDGGGVEYGEFSWVFYNRRVLEKAGSGWGGAAKHSTGGSTSQGLDAVRAQLNARRAQQQPVEKHEAVVGTLKDRVAARELSGEAALEIIKGVFDKIYHVFGDGANIDLKAAFQEFDTDGGGTIDSTELKEALSGMGIDLSAVEIELVMKRFDKDGGGIEYGEFAWTYYNRRTLGKAGGGGAQNREAVGRDVKSATKMVAEGLDDGEEDPLEKVKYQSHSQEVANDPAAIGFKQVMEHLSAEASKPKQDSGKSGLRGMFVTESFQQKLRNVFNKYDVDGSGSLDLAEFKSMIQEMGVQLPEHNLAGAFTFLDRDGSGVEFGELQWAYNNRHDIAAGKQRWCAAKNSDSVNKAKSVVEKREKKLTPMIERDPTYVVKVTKPKFVRSYDKSPMGIFECAMDKIRDKATDKNGKTLNLEKIFKEFDTDGGGTIDKQELKSALVKLGACLTRVEFETVYSFFDRDGGGIEYGEFCWCFYNRRVLASGNAAWVDASGSGDIVHKAEKPRVGDARFRYWYEKDMHELAAERRKAERIERDRHELRLQTQHQLAQMRYERSLAAPDPGKQPDKAWVPGGKLVHRDVFLSTPADYQTSWK